MYAVFARARSRPGGGAGIRWSGAESEACSKQLLQLLWTRSIHKGKGGGVGAGDSNRMGG